MHALVEANPASLRPRLGAAMRAEIRTEFLKLARQPAYVLPALGFPLAFYVLFGVFLNRSGGGAAQYLLATYGAFGVIGAALFALGVTVSLEREQGLLKLRRLTPAPALSYLAGKVAAALAFALAIVLLLMAAAALAGGVRMPVGDWILLGFTLVLGALPFAAIGCCFGLALGAQTAPNVINLVYLPAAALGGLWFPIALMPKFIQTLAPLLPTYHLGQLGLLAIGRVEGSPWFSLAVLAAYTLAGVLLARKLWQRAV